MKRRPALLLAAATALAACGSTPEPTNPAETIRVAAGEQVRLVLRANHSTGFRWMLADSAALGPLRPDGRRYAVPRRLRDRDGAGGAETWTFTALAPGEGTVALIYRRPGEDVPADSTRFRVVVE
jgi:predicted secreted protein